jgi:predicted signal transduction protein with EAL and GGDEF domain
MSTAERIIRGIRPSFMLGGQEVFVGASVGVSMAIPATAHTNPDDMVREADTALYAAKGAGKGRAVLFNAGMNTRVMHRLSMETDLRRVLERGELRLFYQPEVDLATGSIVGVEALLRWDHPTRGLVSPADFIPVAEETDLIVPIGRWVLEEACRQAQRWHNPRVDGRPLMMSVNLSARTFQQPDLVDQIDQV